MSCTVKSIEIQIGMPVAHIEVDGQTHMAFRLRREDGKSMWGFQGMTYLRLTDQVEIQQMIEAHYQVFKTL